MNHCMFERLLYTDCRDGQGRGGRGGFQIQAQSPGVTPALSRLAVENLLYATQSQWLTAERAVEDFPRGFAHATKDDGWGTAQSVYLGKEATGNRSGNYLSDCLLSASAEPYGVIRPAQLWDSELWRYEAFPTPECPSHSEFLEPGPLTNDELQEWLGADNRRPQVLKRLLTTLEDPSGRRVVILSDTPEEALTWIAAATILLPVSVALDIGFKVFVNNLNQSAQRVIAVPKSLYGMVRIGVERSRFIVDAVSIECDEIPVSPRAEFWVERLVEASDPYDVVEAVDVAPHLVAPEAHEDAQRDSWYVAWAVTVPDEPLTTASPLSTWLRSSKPVAAADYANAVARRLVSYDNAGVNNLNWLERQADEGRIEVDRRELRSALLKAEIRESATSLDSVTPLSRLEVDDDTARDAESQLVDAMILSLDDAVLDRLLTIAWRHDVVIAIPGEPEPYRGTSGRPPTGSVPTLRTRLSQFVDQWIAGRVTTYVPDRWAQSDYLLDELCARLNVALMTSPREELQSFIATLWPQLSSRSQGLRTPLGQQLFSAFLSSQQPNERGRTIEQAVQKMQVEGFDLTEVTSWQRSLLDWGGLDDRTLLVFSAVVPNTWPINSEILDRAAAAGIKSATAAEPLVIQALENLRSRRVEQVIESSVVESVLAVDRVVCDFIKRAPTAAHPSYLSSVGQSLAVDLRLARGRMGDVAEVAINASLLEVGETVLLALQRYTTEFQKEYLDHWADRLQVFEHSRAAARAYEWGLNQGVVSAVLPWHRAYFARRINDYLMSLDAVARDQWFAEVDYLLRGDGISESARIQFQALAVNGVWPSLAPVSDEGKTSRPSRRKKGS